MTIKEVAERVAWSYLGKFYKWGGDDPSGFDCSGFCCEILLSVGLIPRGSDYTACGLYDKFYEKGTVEHPYFGCLAFWGTLVGVRHSNEIYRNPRKTRDNKYIITHVEFCIDQYRTIGASGGGSRTRTMGDAIKDNAFIKVRPIDREPKVLCFVDPFKAGLDNG